MWMTGVLAVLAMEAGLCLWDVLDSSVDLAPVVASGLWVAVHPLAWAMAFLTFAVYKLGLAGGDDDITLP